MINNQQSVEKIITKPLLDNLLDIHSIFHTIQGEGPFAGTPAIFIRLAGCNLQCPLCDTNYTTGRVLMSPKEIIEEAISEGRSTCTRLVVITGGEPLRQQIAPLINLLILSCFKVQLETNGTAFQPDIDYSKITVVCSPKTGSINKKLLPHITAYKYIAGVKDLGNDGLPLQALDHTAKPFLARPPKDFDKDLIFLQPTDYDNHLMNTVALSNVLLSCLTNGYRICLQLHKILELE